MKRNNTSFPIQITAKIRELYNIYIHDSKWNTLLKYYQYIVNNVILNPEYEIKDSRGLLIYFTMGVGKTRTAVSIIAELKRNTKVFVLLPKSLEKNFEDEVKSLEHKLNTSFTSKINYISMDAYNAASQIEKYDIELDNSVIIIDEAHNFCRSIINGSEQSNAHRIYTQIMKAKNIKLIMLTGTPISKDPFQLVPYINMLSGKDILPIYYEQFNDLYIDRINDTIKNKAYLANRLLGLISYATVSEDSKDKYPLELPMIVSRVEMSKLQYRKYIQAREKEEINKKGNMFKQSKQKALSMPKQTSYNTYYVVSRSISNYVDPLSNEEINNENSPKFVLITERIVNLHGLAIVYSQFVNTHGLKQLTYYLDKQGYKEFNDHDLQKEELTYAMFTGDTAIKLRNKILTLFNSDSNKYGEFIKVLLISKTGAEGLDLKNVRETHQIEPYWDYARTEQLKARAIRYESHLALPLSERTVQPYIYIATANKELQDNQEEQTIDETFYENALRKHVINTKFNNLLKEVSIECSYFKLVQNCYVCNPTDEILFSNNPINDMKKSNPCIEYTEEEKIATKITLADIDYYYINSPFTVYRLDTSLNGYIEVSNQDVINAINSIVNKN